MAKTIIQTIGPLYGEVVNGTVFGRPNGSVYVPSVNKIVSTAYSGYTYITKYTDGKSYILCNSTGSFANNITTGIKTVAESQDIANYIKLELASDDQFTTIIDDTALSAGLFNVISATPLFFVNTGIPDITNGETYYFRTVLMSANGEPVATSETIELTGYAE